MSKRTIIIIVTVAVLLIGGFFVFRPADTNNAQTDPPPPAPTTFHFAIAEGAVTPRDNLTVRKGDDVILRVTSDVADTVRLQGYNLSAEVEPGTPVDLRFKATEVGDFKLRLEKQGKPLGLIIVEP